MNAAPVRRAFRERFHGEPALSLAPGRLNLIGEHTDYNDGFVLPVAIDRYCALAFASNESGLVRGFSLVEKEDRAVPLEELTPTGTWLDYVLGVVALHREAGVEIAGMDFVVGGDLPIGAGLSSSAALMLATARAVFELAAVPWDGVAAARIAQRAENEFVGVPCGLMDHMAASVSREGSALLLDCREGSFQPVPIPEELALVVLDTGTRRAVADSAYEERRRSCEQAASALGVAALRDASRGAVEKLRDGARGTLYRAALHVVEENRRTLEMAEALRVGDEASIGSLMRASHESLRDLFEVSSPALDAIVDAASRHPAAVGARMTGAGFAGCGVALVRRGEADRFARDVEAAYRGASGCRGEVFWCRAVAGVRIAP